MLRSTEVRPHCSEADISEAGAPEASAMREDFSQIAQDSCLEVRREHRVEVGLFCIARIRLALQCAGMRYVMEHESCITSIVLFSRDGLKGPRQGARVVSVQAVLPPEPGAERRLPGRAARTRWAIRLAMVSIELSWQLAPLRFPK